MGKRQANEMIHCDICGEDYSASYKRCPFCEEEKRASRQKEKEPEYEEDYEEYEDGEEEEERRGGGKRLLSVRRRGGGYSDGPTPWKIIRTIISLALIVAAIFIVVSILQPLVDRGQSVPTPTPSPTATEPAEPSARQTPAPSDDPDATPTPPAVEVTDPPAGQTAESFTLNLSDFTISNIYPRPVQLVATFYPKDSTGTITWTSSNPAAVVVDANGLVKAVGRGSATITATMNGGYTQTCRVTSTISGSGGTPSTATPSTPRPTGTVGADGTYTVVSGDTLSGIASRYGTTVAAIKDLNGLTSDSIYVGQKLKIPASSGTPATETPSPTPTDTPAPSGKTYTVVSGDTLTRIASRNGTTVTAIKELNGLTSDNIYVGQVLKLP